MTKHLLVGLLALGVAGVAVAGETVTEHETYEKRSMKVEPVPPPSSEGTVEERTETSRTQRERPTVIEKHTTVVPGPVVREKKTETVTKGDHDDD